MKKATHQHFSVLKYTAYSVFAKEVSEKQQKHSGFTLCSSAINQISGPSASSLHHKSSTEGKTWLQQEKFFFREMASCDTL